LVALPSCNSELTFPAGGEPVALRGWSGDTPFASGGSAYSTPERIVVRTVAEWTAAWPKLSPQGPPPEIDFASNIVIIAAMGTRRSGGYTVKFERASMSGETLWIEVVERSPGSSCVVTLALTAPVTVAVIPRVPAAVEFFERAEVVNCNGGGAY
jgi:hypothetical protein